MMTASKSVLFRVAVFLIALIVLSFLQASAQVVISQKSVRVELEGIVGLSRTAVRDESYSGAAYTGLVPGLRTSAQLLQENFVHRIWLGFGKGSLELIRDDAFALAFSRVDFRYSLLWKLGRADRWHGVTAAVGAGAKYDIANRTYEGFINDRSLRDSWWTVDLAGEIHVPLDAGKRLALAAAGRLGIVGQFSLGAKWPEAGSGNTYFERSGTVWMPFSDAFSGTLTVSMQYMIAQGQVLALDFVSDGVRWDAGLFWGTLTQGMFVSYKVSL